MINRLFNLNIILILIFLTKDIERNFDVECSTLCFNFFIRNYNLIIFSLTFIRFYSNLLILKRINLFIMNNIKNFLAKCVYIINI